MNSTSVGNSLERAIYDLLQKEIAADRLWFKEKNSKIFRKKGYYSKDREAEIVFDIAVEVYMPGATSYSVLMLVECKNYTHPVSVDDAEEFYCKVQQVAGANVKAVLASTASFQTGTRAFAKSKGFGLLRYFDPSSFKWELRRSPSAGVRATDPFGAIGVGEGLSRPDFVSTVFDLYLQSPVRDTNSLWDFVEDMAVGIPLTAAERTAISNSRSRLVPQVRFLEKDTIESQAWEVLSKVGYVEGKVSLDALCLLERKRFGLVVEAIVSPLGASPAWPTLGRIVFDPLKIQIFAQAQPDESRERFTLAHELAHHYLGHAEYMSSESCDETDFAPTRIRTLVPTDISRMEFQANFLAACVLMPRANFMVDFRSLLRRLDIPDRGFGALFVDTQPCNLGNYEFVTSQLKQRYGVSRQAVKIRLEGLGLLRDERAPKSLASSILARWGG